MSINLYEALLTRTNTKNTVDFSEIILKENADYINNHLDIESQSILFNLIRTHHLKTNSNRVQFELPYSAISLNSIKTLVKDSDCDLDLKFDLRKIPLELQHIIVEFCQLHKKETDFNNFRYSQQL